MSNRAGVVSISALPLLLSYEYERDGTRWHAQASLVAACDDGNVYPLNRRGQPVLTFTHFTERGECNWPNGQCAGHAAKVTA